MDVSGDKSVVRRSKADQQQTAEEATVVPQTHAGIVMPISSIHDYSASHWSEVKRILLSAISKAGFEGRMVSEADDVGLIPVRILRNLSELPVVIVDVSAKNPNVMLELGLRLAFNKPVVLVKDTDTDFSFDSSMIEHIPYPRDLRYETIIKFVDDLADKIRRTVDLWDSEGSEYSYLSRFGNIPVANLGAIRQPDLGDLTVAIEQLSSRVSRLSYEMRDIRKPGRVEVDLDEVDRIIRSLFSHDPAASKDELSSRALSLYVERFGNIGEANFGRIHSLIDRRVSELINF